MESEIVTEIWFGKQVDRSGCGEALLVLHKFFLSCSSVDLTVYDNF